MNHPAITSNPESWRCFHCDEVFTDRAAAADHFGVQIDGCADDVACKINAVDGQLVSMLREAQSELRQYHQEDNEAFRQFHALGAEHATELRREEEKGYARGLEDAKKHPETLGLTGASAVETGAGQPDRLMELENELAEAQDIISQFDSEIASGNVPDRLGDFFEKLRPSAVKAIADERCLVAGCDKPALMAGDGTLGAMCQEHNDAISKLDSPLNGLPKP